MIDRVRSARARKSYQSMTFDVAYNPIFQSLVLLILGVSGCRSEISPSESEKSSTVQPDILESANDEAPAITEKVEEQFESMEPLDKISLSPVVKDSWGRRFFTESERFQRPPKIKGLLLPVSDGDEAILGSTGRDSKGRIYFGVSSNASSKCSAGILQFLPGTGRMGLLGRVDTAVASIALQRKASLQDKIHSKIYEASDGHLYFASLDGADEDSDGGDGSTAGGYLIRIHGETGEWESVLQTADSLIAIGSGGRYVYALEYFGSKIYQFDTKTQKARSVAVSNCGGHVSRNILVTPNDHVLFLRVSLTRSDDVRPGTTWMATVQQGDREYQLQDSGNGELQRRVLVELVEFDEDLKELHAWPLDGYETHGNVPSEGITSFASLMDGSFLFTTPDGLLWRVYPSGENPGRIESLGWIHPEGKSGSTAMFAPTGKDFVIAVTRFGRRHELLIYYLNLRESAALALDPSSSQFLQRPLSLSYGSETMDDFGNAYLVGWQKKSDSYHPLVLQVRWP